ncbi:MAG: hypothetical protein L0Y56_18375, partial [Nitrospira sp.]|nr:hypothetical protein [Nitrospira sp.]
GSSWALDAGGAMKTADQYGIVKSVMDTKKFLHWPPRGLPHIYKIAQWYSWYFPPGRQWVKFMGPNEITWELQVNTTGDGLEIKTEAYGQKVVQRYEGEAWMLENVQFLPLKMRKNQPHASPY